MYSCEILADSLSPSKDRLITMKITFPRFILAEFNTHRMFSRNSASSRAIPFNKMVKMVEENPFIPIAWQKDHKGMQGTEYITDITDLELNTNAWLKARDNAINSAKYLAHGVKEGRDNGVTKQLCNRLLEPFMWHTVIVTATEWENFFKLRCPQYRIPILPEDHECPVYRSWKDAMNDPYSGDFATDNYLENMSYNESQAEIHIQVIAELMWDTINESTPKQLKAGEWHIPFGDNNPPNKLIPFLHSLEIPENKEQVEKALVKIATARCARISYETLGDNPKIDYEADLKLHDILAESGHWSPFEHCAKAMTEEEYYTNINGAIKLKLVSGSIEEEEARYGWCKNFRGFIQYRHLIENS